MFVWPQRTADDIQCCVIDGCLSGHRGQQMIYSVVLLMCVGLAAEDIVWCVVCVINYVCLVAEDSGDLADYSSRREEKLKDIADSLTRPRPTRTLSFLQSIEHSKVGKRQFN